MTTLSRRAGMRSMAIAVVGAAVVVAVLLLALGANPWEALKLIFDGSFGSMAKLSATLLVWVPLVIASASLVITYSASLWNIGVEGQVMMGAVFTTAVLRLGLESQMPSLIILGSIIAGLVGGALWALIAGFLKTRGGVNEIFAGLGLNFGIVVAPIRTHVGPAGVARADPVEMGQVPVEVLRVRRVRPFGVLRQVVHGLSHPVLEPRQRPHMARRTPRPGSGHPACALRM